MKSSLHLAGCAAVAFAIQAQAITFSQWQSTAFSAPELSNPAISGENADPDNDGIVNLMEYAQGTHPKQPNATKAPLVTKGAGPDGALSITYTRRTEVTDLDYIVEFSTDMKTWASGFGQAWNTNVISGPETETVTATAIPSATTHTIQFLRLHIIRAPRAAVHASLVTDGNNPTDLITLCTIPQAPSGPPRALAHALTTQPMRIDIHGTSGYQVDNYWINWYFASIALFPFVETEKARVQAYMDCYLNEVSLGEPTPTSGNVFKYRIRDIHIGMPAFNIIERIHSDSDDAYAGAFLQLAGKYRRTYPNDTWFHDHKAILKTIAYKNILTQLNGNGLAKVFQDGVSSDSDNNAVANTNGGKNVVNATGYLMDNVQAWAGLSELVAGLQADPTEPQTEIDYYAAFATQILGNIHLKLWNTNEQRWMPADVPLDYQCDGATYAFPPFYPHLHCQIYPELYNLPYPGDPAETQRRYNMAWTWMENHFRTSTGTPTDWWTSEAWWSCDAYPHIDIAIVAARRGDWMKVETFLEMAKTRWMPHSGSLSYTQCDQFGYWHVLAYP